MSIAALNPTPPRNPSNPMETVMNEHVAKEPVQSVMQDGVGKSGEVYSNAATATQDGTKVLTDLADLAWSNTKMLNDKIIQNATANAEAVFDAALAVARAKSFSEAARIQSEFVQQLTAKAVAQSKELFDLSSRSTQHVIENAQAAASKSLKR